MLKKIKKALLFSLYTISVVALLLLAFEGIIRLLKPDIRVQGSDSALVADNVYDSTPGLNPGAKGLAHGREVIVDKNGFRDSRFKYNPEKISILYIGDSVTLGVGTDSDSTFAAQSQKLAGDSVNILNLSLMGYNSSDYYNIARTFLNKDNTHNIKGVIVFYCLNDIYDINRNELMLSRSPFLGRIFAYLKLYSHAYIWMKGTFKDRSKTYYDHDSKLYIEDKPALMKSINYISMINNVCKSKNLAFKVVIIPYEYQLRNAEKRDIFYPQQVLINEMVDKGIKVYDPHSYMRERLTDTQDAYLFADGIHLSDLGHRLVAEFLVEKVLHSN